MHPQTFKKLIGFLITWLQIVNNAKKHLDCFSEDIIAASVGRFSARLVQKSTWLRSSKNSKSSECVMDAKGRKILLKMLELIKI
jgi:hypothetical protein